MLPLGPHQGKTNLIKSKEKISLTLYDARTVLYLKKVEGKSEAEATSKEQNRKATFPVEDEPSRVQEENL